VANILIKDPNILGGEPASRGTRLPFKALIDYFEGGSTLEQFLEQYPRVSRELAIAAIEEARLSAPMKVECRPKARQTRMEEPLRNFRTSTA
jgi:uncharacterized protein (DUF433 family)